jgi:SAM-dependent methyltransferase
MGYDGLVASALKVVGITAGILALWEGGWWLRRRTRRIEQYARAAAKARELGRELVVIGAPDGGVTSGYPCGDITVDVAPSSCPLAIQADVTKRLPFADNSVVVFVSCVLEYVSDARAAIQEIHRVSGGYAYFVGVEPWTLTAYLYPGAKRTLPPNYR